jgi:ABC-type phosphate transport system substrate-binding protein
MKTLLKLTKRKMFCLLTLACLMGGGATSAFSVPRGQLLRTHSQANHIGKCCFSWGDTINVKESSTVVPVVVTWASDYQSNAGFFAGLMVNGGACQFYGAGSVPLFDPSDGTFTSRAYQWIILPSDGLRPGTNTFTLCGGGQSSDTDSIVLGFRTLAARTSK